MVGNVMLSTMGGCGMGDWDMVREDGRYGSMGKVGIVGWDWGCGRGSSPVFGLTIGKGNIWGG